MQDIVQNIFVKKNNDAFFWDVSSLTTSVASPASETHPMTTSDPTMLPLKLSAIPTHPGLATSSCKKKKEKEINILYNVRICAKTE